MNEHVSGQLACKVTRQWQQTQKHQQAEPFDYWIKWRLHFTRLGRKTRGRREDTPLCPEATTGGVVSGTCWEGRQWITFLEFLPCRYLILLCRENLTTALHNLTPNRDDKPIILTMFQNALGTFFTGYSFSFLLANEVLLRRACGLYS